MFGVILRFPAISKIVVCSSFTTRGLLLQQFGQASLPHEVDDQAVEEDKDDKKEEKDDKGDDDKGKDDMEDDVSLLEQLLLLLLKLQQFWVNPAHPWLIGIHHSKNLLLVII